MYPSPLNGAPAGTLLLGTFLTCSSLSLGGIPGVFNGEGVKGVEKGWAAEVDVAGGGDSGSDRAAAVVKTRTYEEVIARFKRRRLQRWQIIVAVNGIMELGPSESRQRH